MMKTLALSTPKLASLKDNEILKKIAQEDSPLKTLFQGPMKRLLTEALDPSAEQIGAAFDKDLKDFFTQVLQETRDDQPDLAA